MAIVFSFNMRQPATAGSGNNELQSRQVRLKGTNGAAVLLIHGLTGTPFEMGYLATYLNRKGYSTYCPRLAHHGEPIQMLKKALWQECYQSVKDALQEISAEHTHVFVSGLSMGALLALLLALDYPEKVAGVSCLSPTIFYDGWNMPWYRCFLPFAYLRPLRYFLYFKEEPPYGIKNEAIRAQVDKYYRKATLCDYTRVADFGYPYFPVALLYQLQRLVKYVSRRLPEVRSPVQIVQAQEDDMTSVKNATFIHERIASEKKEIVLLDNSYHVITADQERNKVAEKMNEFFDTIINGTRQEVFSRAG